VDKFQQNSLVSNFMTTCSAALELLCVDRQIDRHGEANTRIFATLLRMSLKTDSYIAKIVHN
jgi:hypothetical protein